MKLKNKKTGEIKDVRISRYEDSAPILVSETTPDENGQTQGWPYNSLAELNEEWEDVPEEEPKEYWYIRDDGSGVGYSPIGNSTVAKRREETGNYFETEEEAEKAVEKLKAWKRLKDKGFRFGGWKRDKRFYGDYTIEAQDYTTCSDKDLDTLFGGEE